MDVRDWCDAHFEIFTDITTAVFAVNIAVTETSKVINRENSTTSPAVREAFDRIVGEAMACRKLVNRALQLPPIPDVRVEVQFRDTLNLEKRWTETIARAARLVDVEGLDRASNLQRECARQGAVIVDELRRVWPDADPTSRKRETP